LPLTFAITVLCAQMVCHETGSVVHSYLAMTSAFHAAIAALPQCSRGQSLCPALDALLTWPEQRPTQRQQRKSKRVPETGNTCGAVVARP
jgi:hypothetical protein